MTEQFHGSPFDKEPISPQTEIIMTKDLFPQNSIGYNNFPSVLENKIRPQLALDARLGIQVALPQDLKLTELRTAMDILSRTDGELEQNILYQPRRNSYIERSLFQLNGLIFPPEFRLIQVILRQYGKTTLRPVSQEQETEIAADVSQALNVLAKPERDLITYLFGLETWKDRSYGDGANQFQLLVPRVQNMERKALGQLRNQTKVPLQKYKGIILAESEEK